MKSCHVLSSFIALIFGFIVLYFPVIFPWGGVFVRALYWNTFQDKIVDVIVDPGWGTARNIYKQAMKWSCSHCLEGSKEQFVCDGLCRAYRDLKGIFRGLATQPAETPGWKKFLDCFLEMFWVYFNLLFHDSYLPVRRMIPLHIDNTCNTNN